VFREGETIRALVTGWLRSNAPCAEVIADLHPVFGGCMVDLVAVRTTSLTAVLIPKGGCVTELLGRVDATKGLAETLWVVTTPKFEATTLEYIPVEAGVLVVDPVEHTVKVRLSGRRNLVDTRALARLLTIRELQRLTGMETRDYGDLVRELVDTRSGRTMRETVCAVLRGRDQEQVSYTASEVSDVGRFRRTVRRAAGMAAAVFVGVLAGGVPLDDAFAAHASTIEGPAQAIDGDTIRINGRPVRLWGVDAVERRQACVADGRPYGCGEKATGVLAMFLGSSPVRCEVVDTDKYNRSVARCTSNGRDVGGFMVSVGWALDYTEYSHGAYLVQETRARANKLGIHAGTFAKPAEYRRTARAEALLSRVGDIAPAPAQGCVIKGNIAADGAKIYHLPSQSLYAATAINVEKGERWFCSAAEAERAGWFASKR
jgi:endonuclease YncB( thermonuclease family)